MSIDPSRLYATLQNTGLQKKDNPLYQVLRGLIDVANKIIPSSSGSSGGGGSSSTTTNIYQLMNPMVDDSSNSEGELFGNPANINFPFLTKGSVIFAGPSGTLAQDNANFFWDDTNKRLGIGTNSPIAAKLVCVGDNLSTAASFDVPNISSNYVSLSVAGVRKWLWYPSTINDITFYDTQDRVTFKFGGNVGIGTINPGSLLEVAAAHNQNAIAITNTSVSKTWIFYPFTNGANTDIRLYDTGDRITFQAGGNVGIGNTNPSVSLDVTGVINASTGYRVNGAATSGNILKGDGTNFISSTPVLASILSVVASTFEKAETGSDANILTYTSGAADEFLNVQVAIDVSAITGTSVVVTVTWKDSNNSTATSTLILTAVGDGTINVPLNSKTATNVVVSSVFVGVSTAYNISAFIVRLK